MANGGTPSKSSGGTATRGLRGHRRCKRIWHSMKFSETNRPLYSVDSMVDQFVQLYTRGSPKWANMTSLATAFGWSDMIAQSTSEYLDTHGVATKFTREMVEAATRVNYGQDSDQIHALEGACSLATSRFCSICIFDDVSEPKSQLEPQVSREAIGRSSSSSSRDPRLTCF